MTDFDVHETHNQSEENRTMMRAKMVVRSVERGETYERITFSAVTGGKPYGPNGENEDNTYSRYTPSAELTMSITNPNLIGTMKAGDTFYLDFTKVE